DGSGFRALISEQFLTRSARQGSFMNSPGHNKRCIALASRVTFSQAAAATGGSDWEVDQLQAHGRDIGDLRLALENSSPQSKKLLPRQAPRTMGTRRTARKM